MKINLKVLNENSKVYSFNINKENDLNLNSLKAFIFNTSFNEIQNSKFVFQVLDMMNLISMEDIGDHYRIEVKKGNVTLAINRELEWDWFEMRVLNVNFTKDQLDAFLKTLK